MFDILTLSLILAAVFLFVFVLPPIVLEARKRQRLREYEEFEKTLEFTKASQEKERKEKTLDIGRPSSYPRPYSQPPRVSSRVIAKRMAEARKVEDSHRKSEDSSSPSFASAVILDAFNNTDASSPSYDSSLSSSSDSFSSDAFSGGESGGGGGGSDF